MPVRDPRLAVCAEWVAKAEHDLANAAHVVRMGPNCPADTVCFHAQQCAEKYLKALLAANGIDFPRTHEIETLVDLLPVELRPDIDAESEAALSEYAVASRYPGWGEPSRAEARAALAAARRLRRDVRRKLPRGALRRRPSGE